MKHLSQKIIDKLPKGGEKYITIMAEEMKPLVNDIITSIQTTQFGYGKYMEAILALSKSEGKAQLVALSLIEAGGDRRGVVAAMGCLGYRI